MAFGVVNVKIDGEGFIKGRVVSDIMKVLSRYQGERYLFIDGEEVDPYLHGRG